MNLTNFMRAGRQVAELLDTTVVSAIGDHFRHVIRFQNQMELIATSDDGVRTDAYTLYDGDTVLHTARDTHKMKEWINGNIS